MALQEKIRLQVEVTEEDFVQVRKNRIIYDDVTGEIVSEGRYHRDVVRPGQSLGGLHPQVVNVCNQVFTPETVAFHATRQEAINKRYAVDVLKNTNTADFTPEEEAAHEAAIVAAEAEQEAAEAAAEAAEAAWETQYDV